MSHKNLRGQVIVLTGASSGIGEQAAYQLADQGAHLCLLARREDELRRVQQAIAQRGGRAQIYPVDLSDKAGIDACADKLLADHARIDVLVNNAGRSIRRPITEALDRLHDYERTIQLNYLGAVQLTLRLLPRFIAQQAGQVVNISTMSTQVPIPLFSAYLSSKSALESFTRSLAVELGGQGIAATTVYFPMVRTPMSSRTAIYQHMPMMDMATAAHWIVRAIETRGARITSPAGLLGSLVLTALPGPMIRVTRPLFALMDKRLSRKLRADQDKSVP